MKVRELVELLGGFHDQNMEVVDLVDDEESGEMFFRRVGALRQEIVLPIECTREIGCEYRWVPPFPEEVPLGAVTVLRIL